MGRFAVTYAILFLLGWGAAGTALAQVEESAEISLASNSDEFQEKFFDALKEKALGNYDRAIALLLECRELENALAALELQLAKAYMGDRQTEAAYEAAWRAYRLEPGEFWYLQAVVEAAIARGMGATQLQQEINESGYQPGTQLALAYFRKEAYREAVTVLDALPSSPMVTHLKNRALDSLAKNAAPKSVPEAPVVGNDLETQVRKLLETENYEALDKTSASALEQYPAEPFFYYARGVVLAQQERFKEAAAIMEEGLLYLLDDRELEHSFYRKLATVYGALGDVSKANMYLSKIE